MQKDPYCVDFHCGFTPHSTHFWAPPHSFSVNGVTDKAPIPHISSTFLQISSQNTGSLYRKTLHSTQILCFDFLPPYHTQVLQILPSFCVHTIPHHLSIFDPPFHTKFCLSMLLYILGKPPPPPRVGSLYHVDNPLIRG